MRGLSAALMARPQLRLSGRSCFSLKNAVVDYMNMLSFTAMLGMVLHIISSFI